MEKVGLKLEFNHLFPPHGATKQKHVMEALLWSTLTPQRGAATLTRHRKEKNNRDLIAKLAFTTVIVTVEQISLLLLLSVALYLQIKNKSLEDIACSIYGDPVSIPVHHQKSKFVPACIFRARKSG